jgi:DNA-binding XRE family transcriptional regulator
LSAPAPEACAIANPQLPKSNAAAHVNFVAFNIAYSPLCGGSDSNVGQHQPVPRRVRLVTKSQVCWLSRSLLVQSRAWIYATFSEQRLARNVRVHRAIQEFSQIDLANAAGIAPLTVSKIEARTGNPRVETLAKIAAALRVEVDALSAKPERGKWGCCNLIVDTCNSMHYTAA